MQLILMHQHPHILVTEGRKLESYFRLFMVNREFVFPHLVVERTLTSGLEGDTSPGSVPRKIWKDLFVMSATLVLCRNAAEGTSEPREWNSVWSDPLQPRCPL